MTDADVAVSERLSLEIAGVDRDAKRVEAVAKRGPDVTFHPGDHAEKGEHLTSHDRIPELRSQLVGTAGVHLRGVNVATGRRAPRQAGEHARKQPSAVPLGLRQRLVEHRTFAVVFTPLGRDPAAEEERQRALLRSRDAQRLLVVAMSGIEVAQPQTSLGHRGQRIDGGCMADLSPQLEGFVEAPARPRRAARIK